MSGQKDREKRREERLAAEQKAAGADRRQRLLQLSAAGVFLAIIAVVVVIVVAGSSGDSEGGDAANVVGAKQVSKLLAGIPQEGTTLGQKNAPVTIYEYGDLQCPYCKAYSEEQLPDLIEKQVRNGEAKISYNDFIIIGPESIPAGEAALAAGEQGKGWNFIELFYRNQGEERSGYVTDEFIESIAKGAGVKDLAKFNEERKSGKFKKDVEESTSRAETYGFSGTPSFAIKGPSSNGVELLGTLPSVGAFEKAIEEAS